ncbi:MAG: GIY-YIG nuclease family protein [Paludibacter sp.]|nr:GIY-YIG nuclease family protein [Paludibacter sp.]
MEPYGFIYITTNMINGKKYIGQKKYMKHWENYLGSGVILRNAINKYGRDNFKREIIEDCITKEDLDRKEKYWISFYDS